MADVMIWKDAIPRDIQTIIADQSKTSVVENALLNHGQNNDVTAARWLCSGSLLGFLTQIRQTTHTSALSTVLGVGLLVAAEWANAPIISPAINWDVQRGSAIIDSPNGWFWGNVSKQVLTLLFGVLVFWI